MLLTLSELASVGGAVGIRFCTLTLFRAVLKVAIVFASVSVLVVALSIRSSVCMLTFENVSMRPVVLTVTMFNTSFIVGANENTVVRVDGATLVVSLACFEVAGLRVTIRVNDISTTVSAVLCVHLSDVAAPVSLCNLFYGIKSHDKTRRCWTPLERGTQRKAH